MTHSNALLTRWRVWLAVGLWGLVTVLAWPLSADAELLEPVTRQPKWKHQFQFAGYYAALAEGDYREAGLDVKIVEAQPDQNPLARRSVDLNHLHDLIGKRVMIEPDAAELLAYLQREDITRERLEILPQVFDVKPEAVALEGFLYDVRPIVEDLRWLYRILALVLVLAALGGLILLNTYRLNRRLRREVQERRTAEAKFRGLVEQSLAGIYIIQNEQFVYVNPKFAEIFGYTPEEMIDRMGPCNLTAEADRERLREILRRCPDESDAIHYTFSAIRQEGSLIDVEVNGKSVEYEGRPAIIGVVLDITEQNRARQQLNYLAFYDPLTDLPNRALFFDRFGQALAHSRRVGEPFALLMLDLDGFKAVNDAYGHETGDALLVAVGQRLRTCVRESDTVARMGGDEFTLLLRNLQEVANAPLVAEKILAALAEPLVLRGHECQVSASIGICIALQDGNDMETLLGRADAAMYQSKARGKNTYTCYQSTLKTIRPAKTVFLEWSGELCVGVPVIDEQHARLAALLNQIDDALKTGQGKESIMMRFEELIAFTRDHFETEERLMEEYGYADAILHKQMHRKLLDDLLSLKRQSASASLMLILRTLKDWLHRHITDDDRRLGEALIAKGLLKSLPNPSSR